MEETIREWMIEESDIRAICRTAYQGLTIAERSYWDNKIASVLSHAKDESLGQDKLEVLRAVAYVKNHGFLAGDFIDEESFKLVEDLEAFELSTATENEDTIRHRILFIRGFLIGSLLNNLPLDMTEMERQNLLERFGITTEIGSLTIEQASIIDDADEKRRERISAQHFGIADVYKQRYPEDASKVSLMPPLAISKATEAGYLLRNGMKYINQKDSLQMLVNALWRKFGSEMPTQSDVLRWVVSKNGKSYSKSTVSSAYKKKNSA